SVAFAPDDSIYGVNDADMSNFYVYTTASLSPKNSIVLPGVAFMIATSPRESDGSYWVGLGYKTGTASLMKITATAMVAEMPFAVSPRASGVYALNFSPDGKMVAAGSDDGSFGIWAVPLPSPPVRLTPAIAISTDFVWNAVFHPSSAYIATTSGSTLAN